ncbi:hypothetical protein RFI_03721 [Reticulomyxa filosa]|uniref:CBS domain-containing protein n=1 Tax=Reticulomyxa filosa TaxID=46433 RepID=X6P5E5_RETFI|nr:hypothetical protein RFI_03721 [Reticulomyxa filosa]|eukprot:ETO33386.1 hypothetical protein RFI_03721 [Reticulomyxa filosa]
MASITKTISSAVIMMEITKETTLLPPMLLSVLVSCGVVGALGESFFDSAMRLRGIPMLPVLPSEMYKLVSVSAPQPMSVLNRADLNAVAAANHTTLPQTENNQNGVHEEKKEEKVEEQKEEEEEEENLVFQIRTAADIMQKTPFVTIKPEPVELAKILVEYSLEWFPVVHSNEEQVLIGEISRHVLMQYLEAIAPQVFQKQIPSGMHEGRAMPMPRRRRASRQLDLTAPSGDSMLTPFHATNVDIAIRRDTDNPKMSIDEMPASPNDRFGDASPITPKVGSLLEGAFLEQLNFTPFQVTSGITVARIYTLFHVLRLANVYVTHRSKLVGVVTEEHLLEMEKEYRERQDTELWRFCTFRG